MLLRHWAPEAPTLALLLADKRVISLPKGKNSMQPSALVRKLLADRRGWSGEQDRAREGEWEDRRWLPPPGSLP